MRSMFEVVVSLSLFFSACGGEAMEDPVTDAAVQVNDAGNVATDASRTCGPTDQVEYTVRARGWRDGLASHDTDLEISLEDASSVGWVTQEPHMTQDDGTNLGTSYPTEFIYLSDRQRHPVQIKRGNLVLEPLVMSIEAGCADEGTVIYLEFIERSAI